MSPSTNGRRTLLRHNLFDNQPVICREQGDADIDERLDAEVEDKTQDKEQGRIVCRQCHEFITTPSAGVAINGSHEHTFFNPAGVVFEIACFASASGCRVEGNPSAEFSWFAGYRWQFAVCTSCLAHLGWFFTNSSQRVFFGLIRNRLITT